MAAGFVQKGGDGQDSSHFAVARYLPDGRLDPSFSRDGRATVDFGYGNDIAYAVAHQRGGRIVVAGQGTRNRYRTEDDFAFARFRRNGRLDRSFSGDGRRTVNFGGRRFDLAYGLAVRGRSIVATGSTVVAPERAPSVAVARLTLGRRPGSRVRPPPHASEPRRRHRAGGAGPAGRPDPGGRPRVSPTPPRTRPTGRSFATAAAGRLDRSFGGDGIVVTDFGTGEDSVRSLAIQDGRILAAGSIYSSQGLARYLP